MKKLTEEEIFLNKNMENNQIGIVGGYLGYSLHPGVNMESVLIRFKRHNFKPHDRIKTFGLPHIFLINKVDEDVVSGVIMTDKYWNSFIPLSYLQEDVVWYNAYPDYKTEIPLTYPEQIIYNIMIAKLDEILKQVYKEPKCSFFISDGSTSCICVNCGKHQYEHINYK